MNKTAKLLCMLLISLISITVSSQTDSFSYYYHSIEQQAIVFEDVVENTQEIVEFTNVDYIYGPGFSPSANWFAYASADHVLNNIVIFSLNNDRRIDVRETFQLVDGKFDFILWSRSEDIIVFTFVPNPTTQISQGYVYILDPESGDYQIIELMSDLIYNVEWLPDDSGIVVHNGAVIEIFDRMGNSITQLDTIFGSQSPFQCEMANLPHLISGDKINYITPNSEQMRVYNYSSEIVEINISLPLGEVTGIIWSDDYLFALLYIIVNTRTEVWLYTHKMTNIEKISIESDVALPIYCNDPIDQRVWKDNLVTITTTSNELFILNAETQDLVQIIPPVDGLWNEFSPTYWLSDTTLAFVWFDPARGDSIYVYDTSLDTYNQVVPFDQLNPITTS